MGKLKGDDVIGKLRFACLCRVSTEAQSKRGQSLSTQKKQLEFAVKVLGGEYISYSGQEHATPDNERGILESLMRDAEQKKIDAVMVADLSRWSRDNGKSKEYLAILKKHGIRFFVGQHEHNLFDPTQSFILGMGVEVAEFFANEQAYKSIINRIERAEQGYPSCGKLPYGRKFNKGTRQWSVDLEASTKIKKIAATYLEENIGFSELGRRFGMNGSNLHKILLKRCGVTWEQGFCKKSINIKNTVLTKIPRLLDDAVIKKIEAKSKARKTYEHGCYKYKYLFSRMIFDKDTGYALTGTPNKRAIRYYKPYQGATANRYMVNADILEPAVLNCLFETLGSNVKLQKAVFNENQLDQTIKNLKTKKQKCAKDLQLIDARIENGVKRLIDFKFPVDQEKIIQKHLTELDNSRTRLLGEIEQLNLHLSSLATPEEIEAIRKKWGDLANRVKENYVAAGLSFQELPYDAQRKLLQFIFSGVDATGKKYGIYIKHKDGKPRKYQFEAYGKLGTIYGQIQSGETQVDDAVFIQALSDADTDMIQYAASAIFENDPSLANQDQAKAYMLGQCHAHHGIGVHKR